MMRLFKSLGDGVPVDRFQFEHDSSRCRPWSLSLASKFANHPQNRVVVLIHDTLFQWDDGVVGDMNIFGADFGAALGDVTEAYAQGLLEEFCARNRVHRVHFQRRDTDEKAWAAEFFLLLVVAQHVADVLAEEAFNAFAKLL